MKLWIARDKSKTIKLFHKCLNEDTTHKEYDTYEQAVFAGIQYVLDNLI